MPELIFPSFLGGIVNSINPFTIWFPILIILVSGLILIFHKKTFIGLPFIMIILMFFYKVLFNPFGGCLFTSDCPLRPSAIAIIAQGSPPQLLFIFTLGEMLIPTILAIIGFFFFETFYKNRSYNFSKTN